jgi:hypothetical protein
MFNLLVNIEHDPKIINTPTDKRLLTILGCAVETGKKDVVQKILELGADVNQLHGVQQISPLYRCVRQMNPRRMMEKSRHFLFAPDFDLSSPEILESWRREDPSFQKLSLAETRSALMNLSENTLMQQTRLLVIDWLEKRYENAWSHQEMLGIAEQLLTYGANPNQKHSIGELKNYTPLMFAAEWNVLPLFELLMKYGGDPELKCMQPAGERDCLEIAVRWGSTSIAHYLENWYKRCESAPRRV